MPRVIGIDPGTVTIDACGLEHGRLFLDRSVPTAEALADPARFVGVLEAAGPLDCVVGPSGYGLPLTRAHEATEEDFRLAFLAAEGEPGGIGGLRTLARALARSALPVFFTPGVIHLPSVPAHRKVNRVDMGTAEKVCAAALAIDEQARRIGRSVREVSFVLLELGGAFTAALAVADGKIVDGGGAAAVAGWDSGPGSPDALGNPQTAREHTAREAFVEGAVKTVRFLRASVPAPREIVLSGRLARVEGVRRAIAQRLEGIAPVRLLEGFAAEAKEGAQGAALIADGLCGGSHRELVAALGIREAQGSVLDHLYVISRDQARRRLGLA